MARKKLKPVIRENAVPVYVYNEGLVVYLYDEANTAKLKSLLQKHRLLKNDFFNNLHAKKFRDIVTREALCVAYTLEQDDPVSAEVGTGSPLTQEELKIARWLEPQTARLSLPSGRLRIDTPNTMPLDPDPRDDPGATVEVEPGEYVLTLYRIDWAEMRRAGIKKKVPDEFLLLTPIQHAKGNVAGGAILEFPLRQEKDWVKDYQVDQKHFDGKLYFYGYWEGFYINLERSAAKQLGLRRGNRLRIETERLQIDALFLGDFKHEDFFAFYGKEKVEDRIKSFKEFAFGEWKKMEGRDILHFIRQKTTRAVMERYMDTWIPVRMVVLPEQWEMPEPDKMGGAVRVNRDAILGTVMTGTDLDALLTIKDSDLQEWNLAHGDLMTLICGDEIRTLVFSESERKSHSYHFLTRKFEARYEPSLRMVMDTGGKCFGQKSGKSAYTGGLAVHWLPAKEQPPVVGYFDSIGGAGKFLRIRPVPVDGSTVPSPAWIREQFPSPPWSRTLIRGAKVRLTRTLDNG